MTPVSLHEQDTAAATARTLSTRERFLRRWIKALDDFNAAGQRGADAVEAAAALVGEWHAAIDQGWGDSFAAGRATWGRAAPVASDSLAAGIAQQKEFATRFVLELAQGRSKMPAGIRSEMYAEAVESAFQRGAIGAAPPGQLIYWRLGSPAERHCDRCPQLAANSPYTRDTLPTVPRGGATPCRVRCLCSLNFKPGPRPTEDRDERPLADRVLGDPPAPPPGLRAPTTDERRALADLETRLNRARRGAANAAAAGQAGLRDRYLDLRKRLNARLVDFTRERGVHHVPTFSVGDVVRSADVSAADVNNLTHLRGIDGATVSRASARAIDQALREAQQDLQSILGGYPPDVDGVPDLNALLRAAGAPASAFGGELSAVTDELLWPSVLTEEALPLAGDDVVINLVGRSAAATLRGHLDLVGALRSHEVAVGPLDEDWIPMVAAAGSWVRGTSSDVGRFLAATRETARKYGMEGATWQPGV